MNVFLNNMAEFQQKRLWVTHYRGTNSSGGMGCSCEVENCDSDSSRDFCKELKGWSLRLPGEEALSHWVPGCLWLSLLSPSPFFSFPERYKKKEKNFQNFGFKIKPKVQPSYLSNFFSFSLWSDRLEWIYHKQFLTTEMPDRCHARQHKSQNVQLFLDFFYWFKDFFFSSECQLVMSYIFFPCTERKSIQYLTTLLKDNM